VSLFTIIPIALCGALIRWGIHAAYFAIALPLGTILVLVIYLVRRLRGIQTLYSAKVVSKQVLLVVLTRATMSAVVQTLLYRLPLHAQTSIMMETGPDKQGLRPVLGSWRQACNGTVPIPHFKQNVMLPVYYVGQVVGEAAAVTGIRVFGRESTPLGISLAVYFVVGQLIGNGAIGRFSGAKWGQELALGPMIVTWLAGIANGSADNCLSTLLFAVVENVGQ
jgi:hypothetical protein